MHFPGENKRFTKFSFVWHKATNVKSKWRANSPDSINGFVNHHSMLDIIFYTGTIKESKCGLGSY